MGSDSFSLLCNPWKLQKTKMMDGEGVDEDAGAAAAAAAPEEPNKPERGAAANAEPPEEAIRAAAKARQMAGLKKGSRRRKRKFTRTLKTPTKGSDQKLSSFDYATYRTTNPEAGEARSQQIRMDTGATKQLSPLKSKLKGMLHSALEENKAKDKTIEKNKKAISELKRERRALADQLRSEKAKSRLAVSKLIEDAETNMIAAAKVMAEARQKGKDARDAIAAEKELRREEVVRERHFSSKEISRCEQTSCFRIHV